MKDYQELSLPAIAGGKPIEQVNYQLGRAIENCLDPNTDPTGVRKVTLTLRLKPNADRTTAEIDFQVDAKLQSDASGIDVVHLSRNSKKGFVMNAHQMGLDELFEQEGNEIVDDDGVVVGMERDGVSR